MLDRVFLEQGFTCVCPPGLIGDGIAECRLYAYLTRFVLVNPTADILTFNTDLFKEFLLSSNVVPQGISLARISVNAQAGTSGTSSSTGARRSFVQVQEKVQALREMHHHGHQRNPASSSSRPKFSSASGRRQLLQASGSGITVTVDISSVTAEEQNLVTAGVNTTVADGYGFATTVQPYNVGSVRENVGDPVGTITPGFKVTAVQYNDTDSR